VFVITNTPPTPSARTGGSDESATMSGTSSVPGNAALRTCRWVFGVLCMSVVRGGGVQRGGQNEQEGEHRRRQRGDKTLTCCAPGSFSHCRMISWPAFFGGVEGLW
jgi:hypothetical protein